jgi:UDP-perosamine 4-acetyltransferase
VNKQVQSQSQSQIIILGAGGHARVCIDLLQSLGYDIFGVFDDDTSLQGTKILGCPILGSFQSYLDSSLDLDSKYNKQICVIAIGHNQYRANLYQKLKASSTFSVFVSGSAVVSQYAQIGPGSLVFDRAVVHVDAKIGQNVVVNTGAIVEHDCVLSDHVQVAPGAILCGNVAIGESSFIGAGAVIRQGITVGKNCMIGAGSVVVKDVEDNSLVMGCPAKLIKN